MGSSEQVNSKLSKILVSEMTHMPEVFSLIVFELGLKFFAS